MRNYSNIVGILALSAVSVFASCSRPARITGEIQGAPSSEIILKQQNINRYDVLDTVTTDEEGRFTYRVRLAEGDPDFIYVYRGGRKLASLLLQCGDKVTVKADTLGHYSVSGSEESGKLHYVDSVYTAFASDMDSLSRVLQLAGDDSGRKSELSSAMVRRYTDYYRQCIRYIMENSRSLTTVPVFYQTVGDAFYVFSQDTDALHFRNAADSLSEAYPKSRYVRVLREEADARTKNLEMRIRMQSAEAIGFLDLEMPDIDGRKVKLSDIGSKAVLLYFWSPSDALQKMFNIDVLKDVYDEYKGRGLEIYQVAIGTDKPAWERVVRGQELGWVNVCDGLGQNSPSVSIYNVTKLPSYFLIVDGQLSDRKITDENSLRKALREIFR